MTGIRVLCVDPDETTRSDLTERLRADLADLDPTVTACGSVAEAESILEDSPVDCVVTEYELPDATGLELADTARTIRPDASVVLFTDRSPDEMDTAHLGATVAEYLDKDSPDAMERVVSLVQMTVALRSQISYPLPPHEDERLATLGSFEFGSERLRRSLDRIVDLAVEHFGCTSASVNIIGARQQEFLTCRGLDFETDSTKREDSICTFTILERDRIMTVEDVREDPRFESRNELLEDAGVRSYLGAVLETTSGLGFPIGTVCIYDDQPRSFSEGDKTYLKMLAELAMDLIEMSSQLENPGGGHRPNDRVEDERGPA